jgi:hypothetical protein
MSQPQPTAFIALPVLREHKNLPAFIDCLKAQDYKGNIRLFVCVNQPEAWWDDAVHVESCHDNQCSLNLLRNTGDMNITVIDKSSKGKGWIGRQHGVGFARREAMQAIVKEASDHDVIISLDADTSFKPAYVSSVVESLVQSPKAVALSVLYYHRLSGNEQADRAILRYEIYMRCYAINLMRIGSPYAFTALGSAIALTVKNYKGIGGITPKLSGEDFYFLQKLRKKGEIKIWNSEKVYPAARFSNRVYFGTGPAMIKGAAGNWSSYPIYPYHWFDEIKETCYLFRRLYTENIETPMDEFLHESFTGELIWRKLRQNTASAEKFIQACHQKIDGLRILQYLKWKQSKTKTDDEGNLIEFLKRFYPESAISFLVCNNKTFNFPDYPVEQLDQLRNFLVEKEESWQRQNSCIKEKL